jgi:hypothetical protein
MASDKSGEIYVIGRSNSASVDSVTLETPQTRGVVPKGSPVLKVKKSGWGALWRMFGAI